MRKFKGQNRLGLLSVLFAFVILWLSLPASVFAGTIDLPRTGQTTCYDASGNVITCTGTGQDGDIQAGVAWPDPRFSSNADTTITDNLTGLIWTKDAGTPTYTGSSSTCTGGTKTWTAAIDYVACLNTNNYLGHTDWRLPNINELESLVNAEQSNSATWLYSQGFNNVQSFYYWSSSTYADDTGYAWYVYMDYAYDTSYNLLDYDYFAFTVTSSTSKSGGHNDWEVTGWGENDNSKL
ncbi:MAG: DUF1566 domain-containing protein [Nitrospirae bacterium]|nr:DUF1566 domain-containing protein [Nitrospirota bacterium]